MLNFARDFKGFQQINIYCNFKKFQGLSKVFEKYEKILWDFEKFLSNFKDFHRLNDFKKISFINNKYILTNFKFFKEYQQFSRNITRLYMGLRKVFYSGFYEFQGFSRAFMKFQTVEN